MITVAAIDAHPALLAGLGAVLTGADGLRLVATAPTVGELLDAGVRPDVVVVDPRSHQHGVRALTEAGFAVVVYTNVTPGSHQADPDVSAVVDKGEPIETLLQALRSIPTAPAAPQRPRLSPQERITLRLYAENLPAKSVARRMGVTEGTVKVYLRRIRAKYAAVGRPAPTKLDLYRRAVEDGILDDD